MRGRSLWWWKSFVSWRWWCLHESARVETATQNHTYWVGPKFVWVYPYHLTIHTVLTPGFCFWYWTIVVLKGTIGGNWVNFLPELFLQFPVYVCVCVCVYMKVKVAQSCLTLCDPLDYKVLGILQARILEWVAFPFSRGSSQPRDETQVSSTAGRFFTSWTTREVHI